MNLNKIKVLRRFWWVILILIGIVIIKISYIGVPVKPAQSCGDQFLLYLQNNNLDSLYHLVAKSQGISRDTFLNEVASVDSVFGKLLSFKMYEIGKTSGGSIGISSGYFVNFNKCGECYCHFGFAIQPESKTVSIKNVDISNNSRKVEGLKTVSLRF
jgi:hypothetical protein